MKTIFRNQFLKILIAPFMDGARPTSYSGRAPSFCTKILQPLFFVDLHKNYYKIVTPEMLQKFNLLQNCNNFWRFAQKNALPLPIFCAKRRK